MRYWLKTSDLNQVLSLWQKKADLYTPQSEDGQVMLAPYDADGFTMDYVNFAFPIKEVVFRQKETLFQWKKEGSQIKVTDPLAEAEAAGKKDREERILFGVRACEADGLDYTDTFFQCDFMDEFYARERRNLTVVAVNCAKAGPDCFCASMKTGPFATHGYDLLLTPMGDRYLAEIGTERGETLIHQAEGFFQAAEDAEQDRILADKKRVEEESLATFTTKVNTDDIVGVLNAHFDHPIWKEKAQDCITCTGCTIVCPTCTCFHVVEELSGEESGNRVRYWDSCQSDAFTRNAGENNPRNPVSRVRYRVYDKFKYIEEKFGKKGCNGCGRCIGACPACIDIVKIVNQLAEEERK